MQETLAASPGFMPYKMGQSIAIARLGSRSLRNESLYRLRDCTLVITGAMQDELASAPRFMLH